MMKKEMKYRATRAGGVLQKMIITRVSKIVVMSMTMMTTTPNAFPIFPSPKPSVTPTHSIMRMQFVSGE
uniref:Uncharacterized protein n=1 Tax=Arundo donax TaxID=35708 RepID=A0A0A9BV03_ARUDO